jgi:asparagine synthase (glutamine-hydrolysing)
MLGAYALTFGRGRHRQALLERARPLGLAVVDMPAFLCVADPRTPLLQSPTSLLVGRIFTADGQPMAGALSLRGCVAPRALKETIAGLWGNFALFGAADGISTVYREPSGSIGVYRCGEGPEATFVSDARIAARLGLLDKSRCDLRFAIHWLQFPFLRTSRTGIEEVRELLPGMACSRSGEKAWTEMALWNPSEQLAPECAIRDPEIAASGLRRLADAIVPAQVHAFAPLLQLSGGLDSSIIAACLGRSGQRFSCINFATSSKDGDERRFAQDVADRFDLPLTTLDEEQPSLARVRPEPGFQPPTNPLLAPIDDAIAEAAAALGATVLIDGGGGDNLFCSLTSASPVADALRDGGPRLAYRTASDIASRASCTLWDVIAAALRRVSVRGGEWKEDCSFLQAEACLARPDRHPWLDGLEAAPPGKREHVAALVHIQHFLDRGDCGLWRLHPLLAQPLMDYCLRVPSYLWVRGGRDRAIARAAFEGILPESVIARRTKGSLQGLFQRSFARLRREMTDILMAGDLRRAGILDAAALETCMAGPEWRQDTVQMRVSELVALEMWLQRMKASGGSPRAEPL